VNGDNDVMC